MPHRELQRAETGIRGLDAVLNGGFPRDRIYLVEGDPGAGKTTLGLQFLLEGVRRGEQCLYMTLSETQEEIEAVAVSHGWRLAEIATFELSAAEQALGIEDENTLYQPSDVELKEVIGVLFAQVERVKPSRVVIDSLSELRLLAQTGIRYRRQLLALKQFFVGKKCTVLLLDDRTASGNSDLQVRSLAHGVIDIEHVTIGYGADRRRLRVEKIRGSDYRSGHHDFVLTKGGIELFPRLVAASHRSESVADPISTGIREFDSLLGGGIDRATTTLVEGPPGTGKSVIATRLAYASAQRNERAALFLFEERASTLLARSAALSMDLGPSIEKKLVTIQQVDPAELVPDQLSHAVCRAADEGARVITIDSLNGYLNALPDARFLMLQLHELLSYLASKGVATIVTMAQSGFAGVSPIDLSYLSDSIIMLRFFESEGRVRKAISVLKKRSGPHEDTIRELILDRTGLRVGQPLHEFQGILTGVPTFHGKPSDLLRSRDSS